MCGLPGDPDNEQARYIEAMIAGIRVASIYLPNGNPAPGPKFDYKLAWMEQLPAQQLLENEVPVVLGGDFNVIPQDIDCYDPPGWVGDALTRIESRAAFFKIAMAAIWMRCEPSIPVVFITPIGIIRPAPGSVTMVSGLTIYCSPLRLVTGSLPSASTRRHAD